MHPYYSILLQEAVNTTGNPAQSLDSLFTALTLTMYSDALAGFDFGGVAAMVFSTMVVLPGRWTGLVIVAYLLVATYACFIILSFQYLRVRQHTMLGNSWYAVVQLYSLEMRTVFQSASRLRDSEVEVMLENRGLLDGEAVFAQGLGDDHVELVRKRGRNFDNSGE